MTPLFFIIKWQYEKKKARAQNHCYASTQKLKLIGELVVDNC